MAELRDIIEEKLQRLEEVPDAFISAVTRQQKKVYQELLERIDSLTRTADGLIELTNENIAQVEVITAALQKTLFDSAYVAALTTFVSEFDRQATINLQLFENIFGSLGDEELYKNILKATQEVAVELFSEAALNRQVLLPVKEQLLSSITTGAKVSDTNKALRVLIEGSDEIDGNLLRYTKTYSRTQFTIADRTYGTTLGDIAGAVWYRYSSGRVSDTREFCATREGKIFHKREIEAWGRLSPWQGQIRGTNSATIFTNLGGWNCMHSLIPVSESVVPKDVIRRNIEKGFFKSDKI